MICGRCGQKTAPNSNYCTRCRWTLFQDAPEHSISAATALVQMEFPRGAGGFLEKRRHESHRSHLERDLNHALDERIEELEEKIEDEPNLFRAQRELGQLTLLQRHWQRSQAHFKRAYELNPDDHETQIGYAIVLAQRGQLHTALEVLAAARHAHPNDPLVLCNFAMIALQARRAEAALEAVAALERLWKNDASIAQEYHDEAMTVRGLSLLQQGKPGEARVALEHAAKRTVANMPVPVAGGEHNNTDHGSVAVMDHQESQSDGHMPPLQAHSATELLQLEAKAANADLLNNLAVAEAVDGEVDKAVTRLTAALRTEPSNSRILNNLAVLAYRQKRLDIAHKYLEIACQIDEFVEAPDPAIINNYGVVVSASGDIEGGLEKFQTAGQHERAEFEALYNLGRSYIEHGKPDKGVEFLRRAFSLNPNHSDVHVVLGAAYLLRGQDNLYNEALKHLKRALQLNPHNRVALTDLAQTLIESANEEAAVKVLHQVLKAFPKSAEALFLAAYLTMDEGDKEHWAAAGGQFLHVLELRPDLVACLYNTALCQYLMGLQEAAGKQLEIVTNRDPSFAPAYFLLGVGQATAKRYDEALAAWQKAVTYEPDNADLHANMGSVYYRQQKWDRAIKSFMAAHRLLPEDPDLLGSLGIAFARANMHNQAVTAFQQSLNLRPHSPVTHSNIGLAYYLQKQVENAMNHWRIVSQLDRDYAAKRDEEQYRTFDDSQVWLRPLNWRERIVKMAPPLPQLHTRLLPGYNAQNYRLFWSDESIRKLAEKRRELEQTSRRLAWMNVHVK